MDAGRFETILRRWKVVSSRRTMLGLLGVGFIGGEAEAKKRRKHKKKRGNVPPPPDPACVGQPDGTACGDSQQCSGEVCATPVCPGNTQRCVLDSECCSGTCNCGDSKGTGQCDIAGFCRLSKTGQPCASSADCADRTCIGFVCR